VGPAAGGVLANAVGDWIPFTLTSAACLCAFLALRERRPDAATAGA
jgi:hypothetical protein